MTRLVIHTSFDCPPVPVRSFDWSAVTDDYAGEDGDPIGRGETQWDAVRDLIEQLEDRAS
jgi:hypothetical protein